jgi:hypothetical protein
MSPLLLLLLALLLAVAIRAYLSVVIAPRRRWVSAGRPRIAMARRRSISRHAAIARRLEVRERPTEMSAWENEGGALATGQAAIVRTRAARGTVR